MRLRPDQQAGEPLAVELGLGEPRGELKILGPAGERVARQLGHQAEVGNLALPLPVALRGVVVLVPGFLDLVVDGIVPEVGAGRIRAGDRIQEVATKRHPELN